MLTFVGMLFARPRAAVLAWVQGQFRQMQMRLYLQRREDTERAIGRIAAELAQRRNAEDGNPDDEHYSDWYKWFTGDPDANVDYRRKQERDLERLKRGFDRR